MNTNTNFDKIDKVLSKISGKELKSFVRVYSYTHDDFATALVEKYWKPERGNYKEQVEACFAHAGVLGKRFGQPQLDWRKIEQDLAAMMKKAKSMKKKGNLIDAESAFGGDIRGWQDSYVSSLKIDSESIGEAIYREA